MNLCADGHDEICYESRDCPFCEKIKESDETIGELGNENIGLRSEIAELNQYLKDMKVLDTE
jgi:glutaredoxin